MIYSHWNQYYPNASYDPYPYQSSKYSPILFHMTLSFILVQTLILSNIAILYIDLKLWQVRLISVFACTFVLSNTVNTSESSRIIVLSILVESLKISEFVILHSYYLETSHYPSSYHHTIIWKRSTEQNYLWTSLYVKSSTFVIISVPVYSSTLSDNVSILHYYPKTWKHIMMSHLLTYKNRHCGGIPSPRYRVRYSSSSRRYWSIPNVWTIGSRQ